MAVFVKICGLTSSADLEMVVSLRPDAVGFVFWSGSKRCVTPRQVAGWAGRVPEGILKVGVFVDERPAEVARVVETASLDVVQLHGQEDASTAAAVTIPVWKAVHVERARAADLEPYHVDAFLFDSYSLDSPGGTGRVADWGRVRDLMDGLRTPVILAGGLRSSNVERALREVAPWGVDVSSGVEERPGKKDPRLVREFIETCRNF